jgi:amino acid permease
MDYRPSLESIALDDIGVQQPHSVQEPKHSNPFIRFIHSFHRREQPVVDLSKPVEGDTSPLNRSLKGRHLQFIAIGGSIGAGLFIGCGKALAMGGPASLLIAFSVVGAMLFCVMHALGELAAIYPVSGISAPNI